MKDQESSSHEYLTSGEYKRIMRWLGEVEVGMEQALREVGKTPDYTEAMLPPPIPQNLASQGIPPPPIPQSHSSRAMPPPPTPKRTPLPQLPPAGRSSVGPPLLVPERKSSVGFGRLLALIRDLDSARERGGRRSDEERLTAIRDSESARERGQESSDEDRLTVIMDSEPLRDEIPQRKDRKRKQR